MYTCMYVCMYVYICRYMPFHLVGPGGASLRNHWIPRSFPYNVWGQRRRHLVYIHIDIERDVITRRSQASWAVCKKLAKPSPASLGWLATRPFAAGQQIMVTIPYQVAELWANKTQWQLCTSQVAVRRRSAESGVSKTHLWADSIWDPRASGGSAED